MKTDLKIVSRINRPEKYFYPILFFGIPGITEKKTKEIYGNLFLFYLKKIFTQRKVIKEILTKYKINFCSMKILHNFSYRSQNIFS